MAHGGVSQALNSAKVASAVSRRVTLTAQACHGEQCGRFRAARLMGHGILSFTLQVPSHVHDSWSSASGTPMVGTATSLLTPSSSAPR